MTAQAPVGCVIRQWKGVVKPGRDGDYLRHLHQETLPSLQRLAGFVSATVLRRDVEDGTEFEVMTAWRSLDSIEAFAGNDVTIAVVPAAAQAMMVRYDDRAVHYTVVL
jgi:heme-degrading monooxygenase HmoA